MRHCVWVLLAWCSAWTVVAAPNPFAENVRSSDPLSAEEQLKSFRVPEGFTIQLVAAEPQINKPINIAIDAQGRLWVTSTIEYPFPVRDANATPRDQIKVLEIDPASGRAVKVTTFADACNIPAGVYPYKNGCIAFSIPNIYFFQDTDGDGVADKRDVLYGPFDTSRDTHGMTNSFMRGFDGFLYATHGFNNRSTIAAKDGSKIEMTSGNVYRMALDGSHVDLLTHGPVNPFGLMFDALGNLYVADCHTKPIQMVLRGAWYEHFGRPHEGIGFYPKIMGHLHGSTAIGGVVVIDDTHWPEEFRGNLICGNPVSSRVNRDRVEWSGSTPTLKEMPDLVSTTDPWFRPVAFALAPDGSIYIADFYNRIIGHYEVPLTHPGRDRERGRIWRLVPPKIAQNASMDYPPDLSKADAAALVATLAHPNVTARMLASDELVDRMGAAAIPALHEAFSKGQGVARAHAMWALYRLGALDKEQIILATRDPDRLVRTHAAKLAAELKQWDEALQLRIVELTREQDAVVRRNAVEALGLHPSSDHVRPVLELLSSADKADTHLVYVARIALRNLLAAPGALAKQAPSRPEEIAAINSVLPAIKSPEAAQMIIMQLRAGRAEGNLNDLFKHVARFGGDAGAAAVAEYAQTHLKGKPDRQLEAVSAMIAGVSDRAGSITGTARDWAIAVVKEVLPASLTNAQKLQSVSDLARSLKLTEAAPALAAVVSNPRADANLRIAAMKNILALDPSQIAVVAAVAGDGGEPALLREAAARALSEINSDEARQSLLKPIRYAPQPIAAKLAVALASRREGAMTLLDAIERNLLTARLLTDPTVKDKLAAAKVPDLDARIAKLTANLAPASAQLDELIAKKRNRFDPAKADLKNGLAVFTKTCAICHQLDGQGAVVGPQLDGVGARGLERVVEDVIDPNRNVDPAFRYSNITLKDGDTISGLARGEQGQTLLFVDPLGREIRLPRAEVEKVEQSKLSLMPTGFGEILSDKDFNDLVGLLLSKSAVKQP